MPLDPVWGVPPREIAVIPQEALFGDQAPGVAVVLTVLAKVKYSAEGLVL
jgi:hypothetical protein